MIRTRISKDMRLALERETRRFGLEGRVVPRKKHAAWEIDLPNGGWITKTIPGDTSTRRTRMNVISELRRDLRAAVGVDPTENGRNGTEDDAGRALTTEPVVSPVPEDRASPADFDGPSEVKIIITERGFKLVLSAVDRAFLAEDRIDVDMADDGTVTLSPGGSYRVQTPPKGTAASRGIVALPERALPGARTSPPSIEIVPTFRMSDGGSSVVIFEMPMTMRRDQGEEQGTTPDPAPTPTAPSPQLPDDLDVVRWVVRLNEAKRKNPNLRFVLREDGTLGAIVTVTLEKELV